MNITVESPEESDTKAHVRINLERAVAKLMVRNDSKEIYTLKNPKGVTYATVRLNNYKFINLANKFYTFRHVATLDAASETPSAPSSYSVEAGNFGNIADNNGYLIDPYFFDKTVAGATTNFTGVHSTPTTCQNRQTATGRAWPMQESTFPCIVLKTVCSVPAQEQRCTPPASC